MAIENLTLTEEALIKNNRRVTANLPKYFDAVAKKEVSISRDFEAFLITKDVSVLQEATQWLEKAKGLSKPRRDRDTILTDTLVGQLEQNTNQLAERDAVLTDFTAFSSTFPDTRFAKVAEVERILQDLQAVMGEQVSKRDQSFYMVCFLTLLLRKHATGGFTPDQERELESWAGPLSAYIAINNEG